MSFLNGGMLWLLLGVPALIAAYLFILRRRRAYTVRFTNLELLSTVVPKRPGWRRHVPPVFLLLALMFLVGALARPTMERAVPKEQAGVMLVLDVSLSMAATDIAPDRITAAKAAAIEFGRAAPEELRIGVAAFSELSFLASPMTRNRAQTEAAIQSLRPLAGTAVGDGLWVALDEIARQVNDGKQAPASVLLLSDGHSNRGRDPQEAADRASQMGVKVFTVGLGTQGATLDLGGQEVPVDLDEAELQAISETTGGTYFRSVDAESLNEVYRNLSSALGSEKERQEVTALAAGIAALLLLAGAAAGLIWFQRIV
ncbi:MAG TPA: VWA domain-containing protein [Actinomycetota bacterium]|nr:VWA domain-containing protein [Actinomycetota bacterium]